jgi:hypothetical protein
LTIREEGVIRDCLSPTPAIAVLPRACYEPPPVVSRGYLYVVPALVLGVGVGACRDNKPSKFAEPTPVVVKDAAGATLAEVRPGRPCRATVGPTELIVGGPPLIATLGATQWSGTQEENGTLLLRDGERIARIYPVGDMTAGAVFDLDGIAQARVKVTGQTAVVEDKASVPIRKLTLAGNNTISATDPAVTITGTTDLVLAALLSAPELLPEVRMLAACERVLLKETK